MDQEDKDKETREDGKSRAKSLADEFFSSPSGEPQRTSETVRGDIVDKLSAGGYK